MTQASDHESPQSRTEAIGVMGYFAAYMAYLFIRPENEMFHWLSLVLLPLTGLYLFRKSGTGTLRSVLASVGLQRGNLLRWLGWAVLIGLALSVLQLFMSRHADQIIETFRSGRAIWLLPLSFAVMMMMAGSTEEIFFRGILMTRIETLVGSRVMSVIISAVLFGLYHLPYAYLNPRWPSAGDWGAAFGAAFGQGIPGGLILGTIYYSSKRNLLACIVTHSLINALPAMGMIKFGGG